MKHHPRKLRQNSPLSGEYSLPPFNPKGDLPLRRESFWLGKTRGVWKNTSWMCLFCLLVSSFFLLLSFGGGRLLWGFLRTPKGLPVQMRHIYISFSLGFSPFHVLLGFCHPSTWGNQSRPASPDGSYFLPCKSQPAGCITQSIQYIQSIEC